MSDIESLKEDFLYLKLKFGTHIRAARYLGIGVSTYRGIRNGWVQLSPKMRAYLEKMIRELRGQNE